MVTTFIVLSVIISILLIIVVLIQKSKGGGLASNFAGSNQIMGVRRTTDFIEKATWTLAAVIAILAIASGMFLVKSQRTASGPAFSKETTATQTTNTAADQQLPDLSAGAAAAAQDAAATTEGN